MRLMFDKQLTEPDACRDLAVCFRETAECCIEAGRELMILADQLERGDGLQTIFLGDVARDIVAAMAGGKFNYEG
jgi:hypothetical protein